MKPISIDDQNLNACLVARWSQMYPSNYDVEYYDPYLGGAQKHNFRDLEKITEWKNVGRCVGGGVRPMPLSNNKKKALERLIDRLKSPPQPVSRKDLQEAFARHAPVYSVFWCHVLFRSPIFDVYTNIAFNYFSQKKQLTKKEAKIAVPDHWDKYAEYEKWFNNELVQLQKVNPTIDARTLDRALFMWGEYYGT